MKLKVKNVDIETGGSPVVIINIIDAKKYDLHHEDRIKIKKGKKEMIAIVDIARHSRHIKHGQIGMFYEATEKLNLNDNDVVSISLENKPESLRYIRKKLDGGRLNRSEIRKIVDDIVNNDLSAVELTYFVAACYSRTMTDEETIMLTQAMVDSGEVLKIKRHPIMDKHCIGGVAGNRTTPIVVPIIAAAGLTCPKTSSRSITSPAGTADTMEVMANVKVDIKDMKNIVLKNNACLIWGGALNLAPADDKIIKVERPLSIDAESQLIASIMAKKLSVSSTHILIDIPVGKGAKVDSMSEALNLKHSFKMVGDRLKKKVDVIITDGSQPVGNGIGPGLEARDILWLLKRDPRAPKDLEKKSLIMAGRMFELAGIKNGLEKAKKILDSGEAFVKFGEICEAQGLVTLNPEKIEIGKYTLDILSEKKGKVKAINNALISKIARISGAPEFTGAGLYLHKHIGDKVAKGEPLFTIYSGSEHKLSYAKNLSKKFPPVRVG